MTREEADFIGAMNMCDEISNEAYKKIMCHCEEQEPCEDTISRAETMTEIMMFAGNVKSDEEDIYIKVSDAVQLLRELPPVIPKTKTEVLDKIKAEIKEESRFCPLTEGLERAMEIIDKYKAESLEQEPTAKENLVVGDCISRKAVMDYIKDCTVDLGCVNGTNMVLDVISNMPSIQPKPKTEWIPVSERLPEEFQRVLVTIVNYQGDKVVRVAEYYNRKRAFQIKENHEWWEVGEKGLLAWMPLPRAYEPQESDLGDYPDSIHNQFDNMTGSMYL